MVESKESTEEIPSYYSENSSSNSTDFNGISGEEDEFWMDLLADSFDSSVVAVASHQLQEKMSEIASLLHDSS